MYTGVTNSLERRLWFHHRGARNAFTKRYRLDRLVHYETYNDIRDAIAREKELKGWRRDKKNQLVEKFNPKWEDLSREMFGDDR